MYRRSLACMAKQQASTGRTIVRDPRKSRAAASALKTQEPSAPVSVPPPPPPPARPTLPFEPSRENQQTIGSTLASYAIAGMAVSLGVGIVRLFIG